MRKGREREEKDRERESRELSEFSWKELIAVKNNKR